MPLVTDFSIDGKVFDLDDLALSFDRSVDNNGTPTSGNRGGVLNISLMVDFETDSDTFFASWLADTSLPHTVDIGMINNTEGKKFLTIKMEEAHLVGYAFSRPEVGEESILAVAISSSRITIGQALVILT